MDTIWKHQYMYICTYRFLDFDSLIVNYKLINIKITYTFEYSYAQKINSYLISNSNAHLVYLILVSIVCKKVYSLK